MKPPKILVGCPTSQYQEYALDKYADAVKNLTYSNYDILLVDNSETDDYYKKIKSLGIPVIKDKYQEKARDRIVHSRNLLREHAIKNSYDYLLSLEQDVIPPKDIIERLLQHKKDIISALYYTYKRANEKGDIIKPVAAAWVSKDSTKVIPLTNKDVEKPKLIPAATGLGCILISLKILKKIEFRYDQKLDTFDDVWFANDLRNAGFESFLDTSIICIHLLKKRPWKWEDLLKDK